MKFCHMLSGGVVLACALGAIDARGAVMPVANFSFESPVIVDSGDTLGGVPSWNFTVNGTTSGGAYNPQNGQYPNATDTSPTSGALPAPADGRQSAYLNSGVGWQDVGPIASNTTYQLTVANGTRMDFGGGSPSIQLVNGTDSTGTVLGTTLITPPAPGTFANYTLTGTTGSGLTGDMTIVLRESGTGVQTNFDNVTLTSVPEPGSLALLGCGLFVPLAGRRRRASKY